MRRFATVLVCLSLIALMVSAACAATPASLDWTICIANDNCPDYTWGLTEEQTRQAFADVVKGHLDEMRRTDKELVENRDCYNAAVTQEVLCFLERYPDRKDELLRRVREGRLYISPYLCNSLWAFQGFESAVRTFYPARRLERDWGIHVDCAHHIELPSLPWGTATILAGCGVKRLSVPFFNFDATFRGLRAPPIFAYEGPDGGRVRVLMDEFACLQGHYTQGAHVLDKSDAIEKDWIAHYAGLGDAYPLRVSLASGTHGDITPSSGNQAHSFAERIIQYNSRPGKHPRLVNATLPQFWAAVEKQASAVEWPPVVRGDFGHSWDVWPVTLAKYAADSREGDRMILAAEALLAMASFANPELCPVTRPQRERAEWCWTMLSDHAWNGTDASNRRHNAELRRKWSEELNRTARELIERGWSALEVEPAKAQWTLFNPLSFPRRRLVGVAAPTTAGALTVDGREVPSQIVEETGEKTLYFVSPEIPGFGWKQVTWSQPSPASTTSARLTATAEVLEGPYYRAVVDLKTGRLSSLIHRATGTELVVQSKGRGLCQSVHFDGQEHTLGNVRCEVVAAGPVLSRLCIRGDASGVDVTTFVTLYADLDQVDFDVRIHKALSTREERLCQLFPVLREGAILRIATPGAVIRPRVQPEGDLLPGADTGRFAVQEFLDVSSEKLSVTVVPWDAFALRMDLDPLTIECLGNDQNYKEVTRDQNGVTDFRFRYSLQARAQGYDAATAMAFSRGAACPLLVATGQPAASPKPLPAIAVDPARAIATCLKPADGPASGGYVLRLSEVAGQSGPITFGVQGYRKAWQTDLLERNLRELPVVDGKVTVELRSHGFCAVRLAP